MNRAIRAIFVKKDGSVSIHKDEGTKPLNYMGKGSVHTVEEVNPSNHRELGILTWRFETRKESLEIQVFDILQDHDLMLSDVDEGLIRDGTEDDLQAWLSANITVINPAYEFIQREYPTGAGPVDLFARDLSTGKYVAIEVKRVAMLPAVGQVQRYVQALNEQPEYEGNVEGILVALDVRPKTRVLAEKNSINWTEVSDVWEDAKRQGTHHVTPVSEPTVANIASPETHSHEVPMSESRNELSDPS